MGSCEKNGPWVHEVGVVPGLVCTSFCTEQLMQLAIKLKRQLEKFHGYALRVRVGYSWP